MHSATTPFRWATTPLRSLLPALFALATVAACSGYLEVRIFNATGDVLRVCSLAGGEDCVYVTPDLGSSVLSVKQGKVAIVTRACTRTYDIPSVDSLSEYREAKSSPLRIIIDPTTYSLFLVRKDIMPVTLPTEQPIGFPLKPRIVSADCKD